MQPTKEQVIQWAREAGFPCIKGEPIIACGRDNLSRFASIVRSAALDEAAGVCDAIERESHTTIFLGATDEYLDGRAVGANVCKVAIEQLKGKQ